MGFAKDISYGDTAAAFDKILKNVAGGLPPMSLS